MSLKSARLLVALLLDLGHLDAQDLLDLGWEGLLNVLLDAAQQERLQLGVQVGEAGLVC